MQKLKLDLDELEVESFETASESDSAGTVHGLGFLDPLQLNAAIAPKTENPYNDTCAETCYGRYTCPGRTMCENTCYASIPQVCC